VLTQPALPTPRTCKPKHKHIAGTHTYLHIRKIHTRPCARHKHCPLEPLRAPPISSRLSPSVSSRSCSTLARLGRRDTLVTLLTGQGHTHTLITRTHKTCARLSDGYNQATPCGIIPGQRSPPKETQTAAPLPRRAPHPQPGSTRASLPRLVAWPPARPGQPPPARLLPPHAPRSPPCSFASRCPRRPS